MVTLIEDIAGRDGRVVEPAECCLRHDQRVVGNDNARLSSLADVLLDKATAKMRAGRVYAFAASICEPVDAPESDELGEPTRKVPGHQVSGVAGGDPAGDQPQLRQ